MAEVYTISALAVPDLELSGGWGGGVDLLALVVFPSLSFFSSLTQNKEEEDGTPAPPRSTTDLF